MWGGEDVSHFQALTNDDHYVELTFNSRPPLQGPRGKGGGPVIPLHRPGERQPVPLRLCGCVQWPCQRAEARTLLWDVQAGGPGFHGQQDAHADGV